MGGFDERFPYAAMEDVEFRLRLNKAGRRMYFVPDAVVRHPYRRLTKWAHLLQHRKSMGIYLSIHPEERKEFGAAYYSRAFAIVLLREIIVEGAKYRWRGTLGAFKRALLQLYMALESVPVFLKNTIIRNP